MGFQLRTTCSNLPATTSDSAKDGCCSCSVLGHIVSGRFGRDFVGWTSGANANVHQLFVCSAKCFCHVVGQLFRNVPFATRRMCSAHISLSICLRSVVLMSVELCWFALQNVRRTGRALARAASALGCGRRSGERR